MTTTAAAPEQASVATNKSAVLQALSGLMMGMFVAILASTVVANALPRIISELGGSQASYTWVVTTELLAMTATVPLWGKLSDLYSKKLLIQLSLGLFVIGSLVAGFADSMGVLIASRIAQGIGAGGLTALAQVIMAAILSPRELGRYSGLFGGVFMVGTVAGPLIGGVLVDTSWLGWRWCFFIGVPLAVAAIILLQRTLNLPVARRKVKIDYLGAFLITAGVSLTLVWSSLVGKQFEWMSGATLGLLGGGLLILALAVFVESRAAEPIVPLTIFRNRTVTLTTVASFLVGVSMFGGTVFLSQYFQLALGHTPTVAGLLSLPMIVGMLVSSTIAGQRISKTGRWKHFLVAGATMMTVGLGLLGTIDAHTSLVLLGGYMVLLGVGMGMLMQNLVLAAQNDVPAKDLGTATSVLSFFRSLGGTIGVSALGAVLASNVAGKLGAGALPGGGGESVPNLAHLSESARQVVQEAYGSATGELFLISAPIALLVVVAVVFLRAIPLKTQSGMDRLAEESAA
ncbi:MULTISPECIES: MDR family MFS transporter [unclassified Crossiella]|uniref:MDR family MFS transporter n=1 Tax=unclassified Crossiella TaxID=2620835 RepID=UPI001FFEC0B7|nr:MULTISPECIES: MDR family MFS transporter [unclassified Crossiella]MCK2242621.1 MFS transporter [Crossiella sp. S99.2]MCK2256498.1 MFS transporter [Crossiella sp. S99.1]